MVRALRLVLVAAAALAAAPAYAGEKVGYSGTSSVGTIVVQTEERALYLVTGKGQAIKYTVGVGRSGAQWFGRTRIVSKRIKPAWKPPASLRGKRSPDFFIESGSPRNPMGAAALVLADNELAIHGTNNPGSIGGFVSAGCIRMHNRDVMDLYGRVGVGTLVVFARGAPAIARADSPAAKAAAEPSPPVTGSTPAADPPVKSPVESPAAARSPGLDRNACFAPDNPRGNAAP